MIDYLLVGHVTQDLTPAGPRLGGTVTFAALTARALGQRVGIVTAASPDTSFDPLADIETYRLPSEHTTTFENIYHSGSRTQHVHAVAAPLGPAALPLQWQRAPIVHLAPVAHEVDPGLVSHFPSSLVGLTPQGWLREWDEAGRVRRAEWPEAEATLRLAAAAVISREDLHGDLNAIEAWADRIPILVVTDGASGAVVYWNGPARHFPAEKVEEVDPTGAGDIFAAAFFVRLRETRDAWEAGRFAVALASASVTREGLSGIPTTGEIHAARWDNE